MIKVLHVVHSMECGGIENILMNIYRKIDKDKIQFDFLVNGSKDNYYTKEILELGGNVCNVTPKRKNFIKNMIETKRIMKQGNYDIVHIHQDSMIAFGIWCSKKAKVKVIFTHAHTTSAIGWYRKLITKLARKYISKNSNLRFACSDAAAKWIYGNKIDYILFKNAIDASKFRYNDCNYLKVRKKLNINENEFVIGTCGRLSIEKNQKFLIEVFAEIKKVNLKSKLIIIGDGDEKNNLINLSKKLGIYDDILFTGLVENVEFYYNAMDCFVLPSFYEGLPLVGIEAQSAGLPCFFSSGVTEQIKVTNNVFFLNLNEGKKIWAKKISQCDIKRTDNYEKIRESGYDIGSNVTFLQSKYFDYASAKDGEKKC